MLKDDLTGKKFNNWEVLYVSAHGKNIHTTYMCKCTLCGIEKEVSAYTLKSGTSKMCRKCSAKICNRNKYTNDRIRSVYNGMRQRCYNKNNKSYSNYGGRGITICEEWLNNREKFF